MYALPFPPTEPADSDAICKASSLCLPRLVQPICFQLVDPLTMEERDHAVTLMPLWMRPKA